MSREGSAARKLGGLKGLAGRRTMLVTDGDRSVSDILKGGYLDHVFRRAMEEGIDEITALQMLTLNPAEYFGINAGIIAPNPWNTIVNGGDANFDEVFQEINEGIYITNVWHTRSHNYKKGDFSTVARDAAFYIKNGELNNAINNIRLSDNIEIMLKNIEILSN